jgi:hypothetical protein
MKHTPGPWHVFIEEDEDNEFITRTIMSSGNRDRNLSEVALMTTGSFDDDTEAANARLVACAPELLTACESAFLLIGNMNQKDHPIWHKLFDVIKKATNQ